MLYSLPAVAVKVLELADDPQLDTHRLKSCIENDPALTSRILQVVNSSLFGLRSPVSDLTQAITLLGTKPLKLLVLGFSLPEELYTGVSADVLRYYWRYTLTKAVAGRELSEVLWHQPGDDAFLVGLLQDLGMLFLIQSLGAPYQEFVRRVHGMGKDLIALESQVLGFDHTALTARLLQHWHLPEEIVRFISWKQIRQSLQDASPKAPMLSQVIHLADGLARILADRQPSYLSEVLSAGAKYRGLTQIQLEAIVAELEIKVAQLAEVLHLDLPPTEDYRTIFVEAHRRLAEAATETMELLLSRKSVGTSESESPLANLEPHLAWLSEALHRLTASQPTPKKKPSSSNQARESLSPNNSLETDTDHLSGVGEPLIDSSDTQEGTKGQTPAEISPAARFLASRGETSVNCRKLDTSAPGSAVTGTDSLPKTSAISAAENEHKFTQMDLTSLHAQTASTQTLSADPGLMGHLKAAVATCWNARIPLSLLLAEPEQGENLLFHYGTEGMQRFHSLLQDTLETVVHEGSRTLPYGEWGAAVILPDCDRQEAVRLGNQLIAAMRQVRWGGVWNSRGGVALDVGVASVAMPPKNFQAEDLLESAARCLYASHASGGGVTKSIEIY